MNRTYIGKVLLLLKLSLVLTLAFVVVRTVVISQSLREVFKPTSAAGVEGLREAKTPTPEAVAPKDYQSIVERNIFAVAGSPAVQDQVPHQNERQTLTTPDGEQLGLVLLGTIAGSAHISRATIKNTKSNVVTVHKVGDTVADATIESIEREAVILEYQGKKQVLRLNAQTSATDNQSAQTAPEQHTRKIPDDSPAFGGLSKEQTRIEGMEGILRDAVIEPYTVGGRTEGLKISGLEDIPMANDLGLRDGDIIQTVNGQALTSKQKALQAIKKARAQRKISVQLFRDGSEKELSFDLR